MRNGIRNRVAELVGDQIDLAGVQNDRGLVRIVRIVIPGRADLVAEIEDGLDAHVTLHGTPVGVEFFLQLIVQLGRKARAKGERDAGQQEA